MATVRILLADDQRLVRAGFRVILDSEPDLEVVAEAADGREAVRGVLATRPDVVLMDVRMPMMDGLEATRQIVAAGSATAVVMLTTFDADEYVYAALQAGARGFLLKDAREDQLVDAVRVAAAGEAMLAPSVTRRLIADFARIGSAPAQIGPDVSVDVTSTAWAALTARECDVVREVAQGRSNDEIALVLVLSPHTVKSHIARSLHKLGLRDRTQLVVRAYETGLVRVGDDHSQIAPESEGHLARGSDATASRQP